MTPRRRAAAPAALAAAFVALLAACAKTPTGATATRNTATGDTPPAAAPSAEAPAAWAPFGTGYPAPGDACRRAGEAAATIDYLDHTRDLVACPRAAPLAERLAARPGAARLERRAGWVLLSLPRPE